MSKPNDLGIDETKRALFLILFGRVDHDHAPGHANLDRRQADAGAAYMVSSMSSINRRVCASTRSTGSEIFLRTGSGMVMIGRMLMGVK